MIQKQITVLISKSDEEKFSQLIEGFKTFCLNGYTQSEGFNYKALYIELRSTKLKKEAKND